MNARSDSDVPYNGDALIGVSVAIAVVQIVVVVARFYTRRLQQLALALDDYLILLALVLTCLSFWFLFRAYIVYRSPAWANRLCTSSVSGIFQQQPDQALTVGFPFAKWLSSQESDITWNMSKRRLKSW